MCKVHCFCRQIEGFYQIVIFPKTYGAPVSQTHVKSIMHFVPTVIRRLESRLKN